MFKLIRVDDCSPNKAKQIQSSKFLLEFSQKLQEHGLELVVTIELISKVMWDKKKKRIKYNSVPSALYEVIDSNQKVVFSTIDDAFELEKWYIKRYGTLFEKREAIGLR